MEAASQKEVECPICLETLVKPIRMLTCGHNFCHHCIESFCRPDQQNRCPSCRKEIMVKIDEVPRNFSLENIIENMKQMTVTSKPGSSTSIVLSGDALKQLGDAAEAYMKAKEYKNALLTLQTLIVQEEGISKLLSMLKKIKCQVAMGDDAAITCAEVTSILNTLQIYDPSTSVVDQLDDEIRLLADTFIEINLDIALVFRHCQFDLIKQFYEGYTKLMKLTTLSGIGNSIQPSGISKLLGFKSNQQYSFMDEIVKEMQAVKNVDVKVKCSEVALFMKYYGCYCYKLRDFKKSIELLAKAIFLVETVFGEKTSCDNQLIPDLYHHLGLAYASLSNLVEAILSLEQANTLYLELKNVQDKNPSLDHAIALNKQSLNQVNNMWELGLSERQEVRPRTFSSQKRTNSSCNHQ